MTTRVLRLQARAPMARSLAISFARAAVDINVTSKVIVRDQGERALRVLRRKAQSAPGPQRRTGAYVAGLGVDYVGSNATNARFRLTSSSPQTNRLELGFTGFDSLGRYYDQPPFPHFGPTLDEIEPLLTAALVLNAERVLRQNVLVTRSSS